MTTDDLIKMYSQLCIAAPCLMLLVVLGIAAMIKWNK